MKKEKIIISKRNAKMIELLSEDIDYLEYEIAEEEKTKTIENELIGIGFQEIFVVEGQNQSCNIISPMTEVATYLDFLKNKFPLKRTIFLKEDEGKFFSELDKSKQKKLEEKTIVLKKLEHCSGQEEKEEVIKRIRRI